jgi:hypothetical protein
LNQSSPHHAAPQQAADVHQSIANVLEVTVLSIVNPTKLAFFEPIKPAPRSTTAPQQAADVHQSIANVLEVTVLSIDITSTQGHNDDNTCKKIF